VRRKPQRGVNGYDLLPNSVLNGFRKGGGFSGRSEGTFPKGRMEKCWTQGAGQLSSKLRSCQRGNRRPTKNNIGKREEIHSGISESSV